MRQRLFAYLLILPLLVCATTAHAVWDISIESKSVDPSATDVNVVLTASWDVHLAGLTVPLVARSTQGGAFWTGALPYDTGGVPGSHPYAVGVTWDWVQPWAFLVEEFRSGVPTGDCPTDGDTGYDGVAPDHFVINAAGVSAHPAEPTGRDFLTFTFDVGAAEGTFEFDTACFTDQLPTIFMIDGDFPPTDHGPDGTDETTFTKGIITVGTVSENEAPTIVTCPAGQTVDIAQAVNLTIEATDDGNPDPPGALTIIPTGVPAFLTFTDNGDGTATLVGTPGCADADQAYPMSFVANDGELDSEPCAFTLTVEDTEPPLITCPADITVECDASTDPANTGSATADDNCDETVDITYSDETAAGDCPQATVITRTWTATDDAGNTATCDQTITVDDTTPPVITCPPDIAVECGDPTDPAALGEATATDNCGAVTIDFNDVITPGSCDGEYTITRTWTATDECGNSSSHGQLIDVFDVTAPVLTGCPPDATVECDEIPAPADVTAEDACEGPGIDVVFNEVIDGSTITRTWTAIDDCGNTAECTQILTIADTEAPVITAPDDITVECPSDVPPPAELTATDNCDQDVTIVFAESSDGQTCPETITRTWTATDDSGNETVVTQTITVDDTTPPTLAGVPEDAQYECLGDVPVPADVTAEDNCPNVTLNFEEQSMRECPVTITRSWTATDACGNQVSQTQTITVEDVTEPTITCPADITTGPNDIHPDITGYATATDNCDDEIEITWADSRPNQETIERTWTATDDCGNSSSCFQIITIEEGGICEDDSVWVDHASGLVGETVPVCVHFKNCTELGALTVPLIWDPDVVTLDSIGYDGSRIASYALKADETGIDNANNTVVLFALRVSEPPIPIGQGLMATLFFTLDECSAVPVTIDSTHVEPSGSLLFVDPNGNPIDPGFAAGSITVESGDPSVIPDPTSLTFDATVPGVPPPCQILSVGTQYCGEACFTVSWDASWLSVTPTDGSLPGQVEVCVDPAGLTTGTYTDSICLTFDEACGNPSKATVPPPCTWVPVTLNVTENLGIFRLSDGVIILDVTTNDCEPGVVASEILSITNAGEGLINWTAEWKVEWLTVSPPAGTTPSDVEIIVDGTGYEPGTYADTIKLYGNAVNSPQYVIAHMSVFPCAEGDTVWVGQVAGNAGSEVVVPVEFKNSVELTGISVPLKYSSDDVVAISGDFTGSRVEYLDEDHRLVNIDTDNRTICIAAFPFTEELIPVGEGLLVNLHFTIMQDACPDPSPVTINSMAIEPGCDFLFTDVLANGIVPEFFAGEIDITCLTGITGCIEDEGGLAVDGCVQVWDTYPTGTILNEICAGESGCFFVEVPVGIYDVRILREGYCTEVFEGIESPSDMGTVVLEAVEEPYITPYVADYWSNDALYIDQPLVEGDVIIAKDPDDVTCGVAYVDSDGNFLIHVTGDDEDATPTIDEGAREGDEITLYLNCECPVVTENLWANHGSFQESPVFCEEITQIVELCDDWTFISYNVEVEDQAVGNVLADIDGFYERVISSTCEAGAVTWDAARPEHLNDLNSMDNEHGYWVYAPGVIEVSITGTPLAADLPLELCAGWNALSYLPPEEDDIDHAWATAMNELVYAIGFDCVVGALTYDPVRPPELNDLTCLKPGHGYWAKLDNPVTLTYPTSGYECAEDPILPKAVNITSAVTPTPWVCDFWSHGGPDGPSEGSVLTVRDEDGVLCGQAVVMSGGMFLVHVYGDNPYTDRDEGATAGSELSFTTENMRFTVNGPTEWTERESFEVTLNRSGEIAAVPTSYELLQNYPNPFNPNTTIQFRLPEASEISLEVFDILGRKVRVLATGQYAAGEHEIEWDGRMESGRMAESGVYFYRLTANTFTDVRKMTLIK